MKRNPDKNFGCNRGIYTYFVSCEFVARENGVTPTYVMEMKAHQTNQNDVTLVREVVSDLLQKNSLTFSVASIGTLC